MLNMNSSPNRRSLDIEATLSLVTPSVNVVNM